MLVSIEQGEDIKLVKGASNSPDDIEVQLDPQTASESDRSLYVIKSISEKTGIYQVTFKAPGETTDPANGSASRMTGNLIGAVVDVSSFPPTITQAPTNT